MKQRDLREDEDQISIFDILYPERKKSSSKETIIRGESEWKR